MGKSQLTTSMRLRHTPHSVSRSPTLNEAGWLRHLELSLPPLTLCINLLSPLIAINTILLYTEIKSLLLLRLSSGPHAKLGGPLHYICIIWGGITSLALLLPVPLQGLSARFIRPQAEQHIQRYEFSVFYSHKNTICQWRIWPEKKNYTFY